MGRAGSCVWRSLIGDGQSSDALTFASDENTGHVVCHLASISKRGVRAVPACMVRVVSSRATFAMIALAASRTMKHDLVWARQPVLIHKELSRLGCGRGWLANYACFGGNFLKPRAR